MSVSTVYPCPTTASENFRQPNPLDGHTWVQLYITFSPPFGEFLEVLPFVFHELGPSLRGREIEPVQYSDTMR